MPLPTSLVVKKGSKMWVLVASSMPCPVSVTESNTYWPAVIGGRLTASSSPMARFEVRTVSWPPFGMASRALTARFRITCSICPGSAFTAASLGSGKNSNSMCSPMRRGSILPISTTMAFNSITRGCKTCIRLNASNWRVMETARPAAF